MPNQQPVITDVTGTRQFACSPAAVLAFIVNERDELLLLSHPHRPGAWEVVNGALEREETLLDGVLREVREEVGPDIRVRPLGVLHAYTFAYDDHARYMLSLCYLLAYEGGRIVPGDDMAGSQVRWWSLAQVAEESLRLLVPRDQPWLLTRAVELHRLWRTSSVELQPPYDPAARNKHQLPQASDGGRPS